MTWERGISESLFMVWLYWYWVDEVPRLVEEAYGRGAKE